MDRNVMLSAAEAFLIDRNVMLSAAKHLYLSTNSIKRIT